MQSSGANSIRLHGEQVKEVPALGAPVRDCETPRYARFSIITTQRALARAAQSLGSSPAPCQTWRMCTRWDSLGPIVEDAIGTEANLTQWPLVPSRVRRPNERELR